MGHAASHEGALSVEDVLLRRTRISFEAGDSGASIADAVVQIIAPVLKWSAADQRESVAAFIELITKEDAKAFSGLSPGPYVSLTVDDNGRGMDEETKKLWEQKTQYQRRDEVTAEDFYERAGIWAEFGKIITISVGYFTNKADIRNFRVTSFWGEEKKILQDF